MPYSRAAKPNEAPRKGFFIATTALVAALLVAPVSVAPAEAAAVGGPATVNTADFTPDMYETCFTPVALGELRTCTSGPDDAKIRVAIMGDSHARQYTPAIFALGAEYGWQITLLSKNACPVLATSQFAKSMNVRGCKTWNGRREKFLKNHEPFDLIFNSTSSWVTGLRPDTAASFAAAVKEQTARGTKFIVIRDNPKPRKDIKACLTTAGREQANAKCSTSRAAALEPIDALAKQITGLKNVQVADFTDKYCDYKCRPILDGFNVYRDSSHITPAMATYLTAPINRLVGAEFKVAGQ